MAGRSAVFAVFQRVFDEAVFNLLRELRFPFLGIVLIHRLAEELRLLHELLPGRFQVVARFGVRGIHDDVLAFDDAVRESDFDGFLEQEVEKVAVLEAQLAELGERGRVDDVVFRTQSDKVFEGHVIARTVNEVPIRHVVHDLEDEVLEEQNGRNRNPSVRQAVLFFKLFVDEVKVYKLIEFPKDVIFRYDSVIQSCVFAEFQLFYWIQHDGRASCKLILLLYRKYQ